MKTFISLFEVGKCTLLAGPVRSHFMRRFILTEIDVDHPIVQFKARKVFVYKRGCNVHRWKMNEAKSTRNASIMIMNDIHRDIFNLHKVERVFNLERKDDKQDHNSFVANLTSPCVVI